MENTPPPTITHRVLLIDLDNCPTQVSQLAQALVHFSRVIVCYGGFDPKLQLNQIGALAAALVDGRLSIEQMDRKSKNAADFGLTFWAGRLLAEMPPETEFVVMSQDNDLDHLINMLRRAGRKVERLDGNVFQGFDSTADPAAGSSQVSFAIESAAEHYWRVHLTGPRGRPARRLTLLNSIRSYFKGTAGVEPDAILQELIRQGMLTMGRSGRIFYRDRQRQDAVPLPKEPSVNQGEAKKTPPKRVAAKTPRKSQVVDDDYVASSLRGSQATTSAADEYYAIHILNQRSRPSRRVALLNSIRSFFKGQPTVDPDAVLLEFFHRGIITQSQTGVLRYHIAPSVAQPGSEIAGGAPEQHPAGGMDDGNPAAGGNDVVRVDLATIVHSSDEQMTAQPQSVLQENSSSAVQPIAAGVDGAAAEGKVTTGRKKAPAKSTPTRQSAASKPATARSEKPAATTARPGTATAKATKPKTATKATQSSDTKTEDTGKSSPGKKTAATKKKAATTVKTGTTTPKKRSTATRAKSTKPTAAKAEESAPTEPLVGNPAPSATPIVGPK
jgi:hypothetical protein